MRSRLVELGLELPGGPPIPSWVRRHRRSEVSDRFVRQLVELAGIGAGSKVLELAAGAAKLSLSFARRGARAIAVLAGYGDPLPSLVSAAREGLDLEALEWRPARFLEPEHFDVAVRVLGCSGPRLWSLMPRQELIDLCRALRPGGCLVLEVPCIGRKARERLIADMSPWTQVRRVLGRRPWGRLGHRGAAGERCWDQWAGLHGVDFVRTSGTRMNHHWDGYRFLTTCYRPGRLCDLLREVGFGVVDLYKPVDAKPPGEGGFEVCAERLVVAARKER